MFAGKYTKDFDDAANVKQNAAESMNKYPYIIRIFGLR